MTVHEPQRAGDIRQWESQTDLFQGHYPLVETYGPNTWLCENFAPTDDETAAILASRFGDQEEVQRRIDRAGRRFVVRLVRSGAYSHYF